MRIGRCAARLAVASAMLSGCGGGGGGGGGGGSTPLAIATQPEQSPAPIVVSPNITTLPISVHGPTVCTVYDATNATQVMFASPTFDVRAECQAWAQGRSGEGYLWGYQPGDVGAEPTDSRELCYLLDTHGRVAARVIEATGFRPVSKAEIARGASACMSLESVGWIVQTPAHRRTAPHSHAHR